MTLHDLLTTLGPGIDDPEEETFLLFSQPIPSHDLGFVNPKATEIDVTVRGRDFNIVQSPGLLSSNREGGTTGAVVWKITPLFAEWIASDDNVLFHASILDRNSTVIELGCGLSGIVALSLAPKIEKFIATDQEYTFKLLKRNIENNTPGSENLSRKKVQPIPDIEVVALDWESDSVSSLPTLMDSLSSKAFCGFDALIACDCIYNEALIEPFVRTCTEICRLSDVGPLGKTAVCIIAQQLRSDIVFQTWLSAFYHVFHVWRLPDQLLTEGLREHSGFIVHLGVLRRTLN